MFTNDVAASIRRLEVPGQRAEVPTVKRKCHEFPDIVHDF